MPRLLPDDFVERSAPFFILTSSMGVVGLAAINIGIFVSYLSEFSLALQLLIALCVVFNFIFATIGFYVGLELLGESYEVRRLDGK